MKNSKIVIHGKSRLSGSVRISGAKNAALPELASALLSKEQLHFEDVPEVEDIKVMFKALENLGAKGEFHENEVRISIPEVTSADVPSEIVETSRASILILGPLVARNGYAKVSKPGGCPIGDRKFDLHLEGLRQMGVEIIEDDYHIIARTANTGKRLQAVDYTFKSKTVTGTENLLMAATLAEGTSVLRNCALEPEVSDLIRLLIKMGSEIDGIDTETITIKGKPILKGTSHKIIPDRIEMGTYVIAGCFGGNEIRVTNAVPEYIRSLLDVLEGMGIHVNSGSDFIEVRGKDEFNPAEVETLPYPDYPTDLQAQLTTLFTQANGVSKIKENIFNNRFQHTIELNKMGSDIKVQGDVAIIRGKTLLKGTTVVASDLRASAALILGGLIADGTTVVENAYQLFRGYEKLPEKLKALGAKIDVSDE